MYGSGEKLYLTEEKNHMFTLELASHDKEKVLSAIAELQKLEMVLVAEPSYLYEVQADWAPKDPSYNEQWGLYDSYGIQAEQAWDITRGSTDIKVGIMEGGIDMEHEDLQGRVFPGNCDSDPKNNLAHGTHVAGIIGAKKNNIGVTGVADCSMYLLNWNSEEFANSLIYATQNNIKIINASFHYPTVSGGYAPYNSVHYTALANYDGVFIVAAGNKKGEDNDEIKHYPACYDLPNVISVSSIDSNGDSSASNYGKNSVDLYAPGEYILSTYPTSLCGDGCFFFHHEYGYHYDFGTSMAAPFVTGVAALMLSENPNLTASEIKEALISNVDKVDSLADKCVSGGRLNAYKAVKSVHTSHRYDYYKYINGQHHRSTCACGASKLSAHWAYSGNTGRYVDCGACGVAIDTWQYPILILGTLNSVSLMSADSSLISNNSQLVSYLDFAQAETVLTNEQIGEITEYYDEKFFAEYSIMFGDIESDEVLYWLLKNATGWPAD